ncbi:MAG: fibrobacter succinogenes major paralogous domain-containing protein [Bacteroidales bacterium]
MKKIIFLCFAVLTCTMLLLHSGCMKDEASLPGEKLIKSSNLCDCIDPCNPVYCEETLQKVVTWGNPKHQFSKTVDVICYNTLSQFVIKVKSSEQWADMLIDGVSVWTQGPVAANIEGVYSVDLPIGWENGDDYDFTLKVVGSGPQAIFDIEYSLVGECPKVADADGNLYRVVKIGTQTWMAENLMTTKYNDNTSIPLVENNAAWGALTTPGYCWYGNSFANYGSVYGALYNWYAVETGKLCPTGWHVSTDADWTTLISYLGVTGAGGILKEAGLDHWTPPNTGATDANCFTALPGGYRSVAFGTYWQIGEQGHWWSATEFNTDAAWGRVMYHDASSIGRYAYDKNYGFSVRCVKDN